VNTASRPGNRSYQVAHIRPTLEAGLTYSVGDIVRPIHFCFFCIAVCVDVVVRDGIAVLPFRRLLYLDHWFLRYKLCKLVNSHQSGGLGRTTRLRGDICLCDCPLHLPDAA
jgi:hypothetical protein